MKKLINIFESKRSIAGLFLVAGLVFTTYNIQENAGQIKRLTNFESGIQTCFTRVNQTYTANLLGDTASTYLTQNFQNLTEECFAEGILSVENAAQAELSGVAKLLSHLASNVHWFHEDILAPVTVKNKAGQNEARDVGTRFEKIETRKDEILELTEAHKGKITASLNNQKNIFYVSATFLFILMLAEYMSMTRRRLSNNAREKEAGAELSNNGGVTSVKVGEIIRVALEQNELQNCSKLFANFHAHAMLEKSKNKMTLETLVTPMGVSENYNTSAINKLWEDDSVGISADTITPVKLDNINLEQTSSQVVDLLSEKLFSQGVQLNMNIPEGIMIQGRQEELEQAFYHLFAFAINSTQTHTFDKSITIQAHKLGDIVAFDLVHSGNGETTPELNIDLEVCQSLLEEVQAKIQLDKKIDQGGNVVGGRVKIIFKTGVAQTAAASQGRLVDLKVGSKKDIMASILNDLA